MSSSAALTYFFNASRDGKLITCLGSLLKLFKTLIVIFFPNISSKPHLVQPEVIILLCIGDGWNKCEHYLSFGYLVINKCWSFCLCNCIESSWTKKGPIVPIMFSYNQTYFKGFVLYCTKNIFFFFMSLINFAFYNKQNLHDPLKLKYFGLQFKRRFMKNLFKNLVSGTSSYFLFTL